MIYKEFQVSHPFDSGIRGGPRMDFCSNLFWNEILVDSIIHKFRCDVFPGNQAQAGSRCNLEIFPSNDFYVCDIQSTSFYGIKRRPIP